MNKSLQDQLLKAGLIDTKKAKKITKESRKEKKQKIRNKDNSISESQAAVLQAQKEKQERDRKLNLQLAQEAEKKAIAAQVVQLVEHYKLKREAGDLEYNFSDNSKIKKIRVSPNMLEEIVRGRLCVARKNDTYEIIPKPIADKIRERDATAIVVYNADTAQQNTAATESDDDYYAQFEIPDDLTW